MKGWVKKQLSDVSAINYGYTESASQKAVGPRFLRITDIQDDQVAWDEVPYCPISDEDLKKYRLADGDIVFARTGATTGKSFLVADPPEAVFASYLIRLRLTGATLLPRFVSLFFQTEDYWQAIREGSSGSAQGGFNASKLGALEIPVPPLAEQQRIVGVLDEAMAGIATARAHAETNLQNARALFESHLYAVFTQRGQGWVETTLGDQVLLQRGFDITKEQQREGHVPVVSSGGIKSYHDTAAVHGPGVVMGRKGTLGKVFYLNEDYWPHDTTLWVKDFKGNNPRLVYHFFSGLDVSAFNSGTANPALNRNQIHPLLVNWPPVNQQEEIVTQLDALSAETQRLAALYERKLVALEELKKSLLHQAFAGEL